MNATTTKNGKPKAPPDKCIAVPPDAHALLQAIARAEDRNMRSVLFRALAKYAPRVAADFKRSAA